MPMTKLKGAVLAALLTAPLASAQLATYEENFESLDQTSGSGLGDAGWQVFAAVFDPTGANFLFNYGPFPAPNQSGAFSNIAAEEGGPDQGLQQLVPFSDYNNNAAHNAGNRVATSLFQEFTVGVFDVGTTWQFGFDAKRGDIGGSSQAFAFIRTIDPSAGFALTNEFTQQTTAIPDTWARYTLSIEITDDLVGQLLQIGFATNASNFEPSGVFYDNLRFAQPVADSDGDGVGDDVDNCTNVSNPDQRDTNGDGFGNICDADLNNDNTVNVVDLGIFRSVFFSSDADADFNGDGTVNVVDLGILRGLFFAPPGPGAGIPSE
ncbi:MAG: thrombospondin type 3 repeat-containing protein [Pseudomonadota bacterium]